MGRQLLVSTYIVLFQYNNAISHIFIYLFYNYISIHLTPQTKVQMKWHLIGLNDLMEIVVMDRRKYYRYLYASDYNDQKYIEEITLEYVALDQFVVFGERYGN